MDKSKQLEVKRVGVLSVGKVCALLGAFFGFVFGVLLSILLHRAAKLPQFQETGLQILNIWQLIVLPFYYLLFFGIFCGVVGILFALVYNLIARSGGLKFSI